MAQRPQAALAGWRLYSGQRGWPGPSLRRLRCSSHPPRSSRSGCPSPPRPLTALPAEPPPAVRLSMSVGRESLIAKACNWLEASGTVWTTGGAARLVLSGLHGAAVQAGGALAAGLHCQTACGSACTLVPPVSGLQAHGPCCWSACACRTTKPKPSSCPGCGLGAHDLGALLQSTPNTPMPTSPNLHTLPGRTLQQVVSPRAGLTSALPASMEGGSGAWGASKASRLPASGSAAAG